MKRKESIYKKNPECPVCQSAKTEVLYKENIDINKLSFTYAFSPQVNKTFRVVRCLTCTHVFCNPLPRNIYKNYVDVVDNEYLKQQDDRQLTAKVLLNTIAQYKKKGTLLDVGCATGDFLLVAKEHGYTVQGLELSKWSSKIAKDKGISVHRKLLKDYAKDVKNKFDIVTMWGVIEHFEDPYIEMKYIHKILKPGGIVVVWTGDVGSITSKMLGRNWWYWMGQHIQYFSIKSMRLLGKRTGFNEVFSKTYPQVFTLNRISNSLDRYKLKPALLLPFQAVFMIKPTWNLKIPGEMFWMAQKNEKQNNNK